jgi:hypothetical protein
LLQYVVIVGRILRYSEIENNKLPDFPSAKNYLLDKTQRLADVGQVIGMRIYGSVATGTANPRSDMDIFTVIKDISVWEPIRKIYKTIKNQFNVVIEIKNIIPLEFAVAGKHTANKVFVENINLSPREGNIIGQDPLEIIGPMRVSIFDNHTLFLSKKRGTFTEGYFADNSRDIYSATQKALETPVNVGREILQMLPHLGYPLDLKDISKRSVVNKFNEIFGGTNLVDEFNILFTRDQEYAVFLNEAILGRVTKSKYQKYVKRLFTDSVPMACRWVNKMDLTEQKLIERHAQTNEGDYLPVLRGKEG